MRKKYYKEFETFEDLVKTSPHYIYCAPYKNDFIYYTGEISDNILLIRFYRTNIEIKGYVSLNKKGELIVEEYPLQNYIPIIKLKYCNFISEMLIEYNKKK
jgi:hypothetical protein